MLNKYNIRISKRKYAFYALFALVIFVAAAYFGVLVGDESMTTILVSMGAAITAIAMVTALRERGGGVIRDERTIRVNRVVMSVTLSITYMLIATLVLLLYFNVIEVEAETALGMLLFTIAISQIVLEIIFSRKGNIE